MTFEAAIPDPARAGQAIYTPATLALYDLVVLAVSNPLIWRCPTRRILELYDRHVATEHLDVGVGTGWYLDHCRFPRGRGASARGAARPQPSLAVGSVAAARALPAGAVLGGRLAAAPRGSRAVRVDRAHFLLHCLPGAIEEKAAVVIDNLAPLLRADGVVFGATLLSAGVKRSRAARALMRAYNRKGVFSNEADSLAGLRVVLERRFRSVELEVVGCAALFAVQGRGRRARALSG